MASKQGNMRSAAAEAPASALLGCNHPGWAKRGGLGLRELAVGTTLAMAGHMSAGRAAAHRVNDLAQQVPQRLLSQRQVAHGAPLVLRDEHLHGTDRAGGQGQASARKLAPQLLQGVHRPDHTPDRGTASQPRVLCCLRRVTLKRRMPAVVRSTSTTQTRQASAISATASTLLQAGRLRVQGGLEGPGDNALQAETAHRANGLWQKHGGFGWHVDAATAGRELLR